MTETEKTPTELAQTAGVKGKSAKPMSTTRRTRNYQAMPSWSTATRKHKTRAGEPLLTAAQRRRRTHKMNAMKKATEAVAA